MFRLKLLPASLAFSLALALSAGISQAQNSTGIRLGNTDFGGQGTPKLGTSSHHQQGGSFKNNASDPHVYQHRKQSSGSFSGHSGRVNKHHNQQGRRSYGNNADDPHFYQYREHSRQSFSSGSGKHHKRYKHSRPTYGISGHPSFGLSGKRDYYRKHHNYNQRQYQNYGYKHNRLYFYTAPIAYSVYESHAYSTPVTTYSEDNYSVESNTGFTQSDAWDALGNYEIDTARYAFESLIQQRPNSALSRVGYALSTALSGDVQTGAYIMEEALLSDVSDLRYFSADQDLQLVIEELLLSYQDDPLMTASLHYFMRDYQLASQAVNIAANECQQCPAVTNLTSLINQHI